MEALLVFVSLGGKEKKTCAAPGRGKRGQESTFGAYAGLGSWVSLLRQKVATQT